VIDLAASQSDPALRSGNFGNRVGLSSSTAEGLPALIFLFTHHRIHSASFGRAARNKWQFWMFVSCRANEEANMPVLILWAVPAIVVIGGVGYYLVRAVN
jgi:hypothetical protein